MEMKRSIKHTALVSAIILIVTFILWYAIQTRVVHGKTVGIDSLIGIDAGIGKTPVNYTAVLYRSSPLLFISFVKKDFDLLESVDGWTIISISEPPRARPYEELSISQRAYFPDLISESDLSVTGVLAKKDNILIQAFYSKETGVYWGLVRGVNLNKL